MRKFLISSISFILAALILLVAFEYYAIYTLSYTSDLKGGWEVYEALKKSKQKKATKRLVFGDSVGMQMYPCDKEHGDILSLTCNQAVSFAGYYFLLKNYFGANKESLPEEVILLCHPYTFANNLDGYAYHYFLKPFYMDEYKPLMDEHLQQRIKSIPWYWSSQLPFSKTTDYTFEYTLPKEKYALVSPITAAYLPRIIDLVEEHNVQFRMVSVPIKAEQKPIVDKRWSAAISKGELVPFERYLNEFTEWDVRADSCYQDKVHFASSFVPKDYLQE